MNVPDSWTTQFAATWLAAELACAEVDARLATIIGAHRGIRGKDATPSAVLPLQCKSASELIKTQGMTPSTVIHATISLALLGELLICAEDGGILRKDTVIKFAGYDAQESVVPEGMRLLRNAVCHPASTTEDPEEGGVASLAGYIESELRLDWGRKLNGHPELLASREVGMLALHFVNALGWNRADRWGLKMRDAKRPHRSPSDPTSTPRETS